jgi:hypothetical protein
MKRWVASAFLLSSFLVARSAFPQNTYYFPQVANGSFGTGSFKTTFVLFNNTDTSATAVLKLTDDQGNPLTVNIPGLGGSGQITLGPGASQVLQTDGAGPLVAGAATVASTVAIGVTSIFTIYDTSGNFVTEAGVGNSQPLTKFVIPVDVTGAFDTGLALFNPNTGPASVTLSLYDSNGTAAASPKVLPTLGRNAHLATFVDQQFSISNFRGTLVVQSSVAISALTLRQNSSRSAPTYTSLPVVPWPSSQAGVTMNFPQVANGSYGSISFKTSFLIFNTASSTANVVLALTQDNGSPFTVTIPGSGPGTGTNSNFNFSLGLGAAVFLQTDGLGAGTAGAATITSNVPVGAAAIFTVLNSAGQFQTEAGVGDSPNLTDLTLPVDITGSFDTGVAFFNPGSSSLTMTLRLMDANGANVGTSASVPLAAKNHTAKFVSQLFPGTSNFRGSVAISAPGGVAALTLRQNSSPLSYTTLPVASGTSKGTTQAAPLLSQTQTGVNLTSSQVINQMLPAGYRLSGTISGSGKPNLIVAQSGATSLFSGRIDAASGKYLIVVPGGSYSLKVCYQPSPLTTAGTICTYSDPSPVQVSADTTRDIALPALSLFKVSGTISGLSNITPTSTSVKVVFTSDTTQGTFSVDSTGNYQGSLPAGSYRANISAGIQFSILQTETLAIYNLGTAAVSADATGVNFTVPATATLSGRVQGPSLTPPLIGTFVAATDTGAPQVEQVLCAYPPVASGGAADMLSGQYQLLLASNRTYSPQVTVMLLSGETFLGSVLFPVPTASPLTLTSNATLDFNLPAFPAQVTVSGQVTDSSGRGVSGVSVSAYSQALTGAASLGFTGGAATDSSGSYRFVVLSGTNYQLSFTPPPPAP